jgi:N-acetylneuraminic acid mutarotase
MKETKMLAILVLALGMATVSPAVEETWTRKTNMPTARYVLSTSAVDGKIYAIGGGPGETVIRTVEEYDPAMDTWTGKADMPMAEGAGSSSAVNGKIYFIGGAPSQWAAAISSVQEYDVATDTWATKADMPTARGWLSTSVVNGKIYAIGGALSWQGSVLSTVEEYDPATDTWKKKADMPTARGCLSTSAVNGKIYAIGGTLSKPWPAGISIVEEYDPATDTWTKKADMPTRRSYLSTSMVNGKIYAIGGCTSNYIGLSLVEEYDPATDTWAMKVDMPTPRWGLSTSAVNGKIYAIGGRVAKGAAIPTVEEYDPFPLVVDFNGDWKVDIEDLIVLIEHWGTDEPLCDIAPQPFGDGIVDALDLEVLMSHWGQEILDPALMSYWKLDETEGNIAYDSVDARDGVVIGEAMWQPEGGMVDGALQLDGIDDYVSTDFVLNPGDGPFSVFAWIKGGAPGQVILSQESGVNWLMADAVDGALKTDLRTPAKPGRIFTPAGPPLICPTVVTDGDWHRVGFVRDGSDRILYADDIEVARDTATNLESASGGLYIGAGSDLEPGALWFGLIDDVRIYNRAVTP